MSGRDVKESEEGRRVAVGPQCHDCVLFGKAAGSSYTSRSRRSHARIFTPPSMERWLLSWPFAIYSPERSPCSHFGYGSRTLEPRARIPRLGGKEMAEWLYDIQRLNFVTDAELSEILRERGLEGWELVQIIPPSGSEEQTGYRLIFKSQNAPIGGSPS